MDALKYTIDELKKGNLNIIYDTRYANIIQAQALRILNMPYEAMTPYDMDILNDIIIISNIIYNNSESFPPLDDGIYDKLMVRYGHLNPNNYQIGSPVVNFNNQIEEDTDVLDGLYNPILIEPKSCREGLFYDELSSSPPLDLSLLDQPVDRTKYPTAKKQNIVVPHKYPKLVGTLDKCKFVLNKEAIDYGCFDDPDITIFERDFLGKHIQQGIIDPRQNITLILELKYDGMSVEADVTNKIISARSRGDVNQDLAEDLTSVLGDYVFPRAPKIKDSEAFGMKFECIITKNNLYRLGELKGRPYKNARNGVVGLMKSLDAYAYRDLITLVPLETSLYIDPIAEIEFMNKYFTTDVYLKYAVVQGDYNHVLFQVFQFVKEASAIREYMPFMYDGVVVHYYDSVIKERLGRVNNVNKYSVAIKFNPMTKDAKFLGYTFTVGQNGVITPMIHHTPVEFIGTIHTKSSGHSLQRFNELRLAIGDTIEIQYRNDVMCYVTRRVEDIDPHRHRDIVEFPLYCPVCGNRLSFYDSGKTAICTNYECPGRRTARVVNMMKKLNIKGFAESSVDKIGLMNLTDLISITNTPERVITALGDANGRKFLESVDNLRSTPIDDYRVIGSLGFTNIAIETWKKILQNITINDIIYNTDAQLYQSLQDIKGIGETTARTVMDERHLFMTDLKSISLLGNVRISYHAPVKRTVRYTGCRPDDELTAYLEAKGFDANPNASVTKSTDILIVPEVGHDSSKVRKCGPQTKIIAIDEFKRNIDYYLRE